MKNSPIKDGSPAGCGGLNAWRPLFLESGGLHGVVDSRSRLPPAMRKSFFLAVLKTEIQRYDFSHFIDDPPSVAEGGEGVVVAGCPACRKRINTMREFLDHLADDAVPALLLGTLLLDSPVDQAASLPTVQNGGEQQTGRSRWAEAEEIRREIDILPAGTTGDRLSTRSSSMCAEEIDKTADGSKVVLALNPYWRAEERSLYVVSPHLDRKRRRKPEFNSSAESPSYLVCKPGPELTSARNRSCDSRTPDQCVSIDGDALVPVSIEDGASEIA